MRRFPTGFPVLLSLFCAINGAFAAPDPPGLVTPADGGAGLGADLPLCVQVTDPQGLPLDVTFYGRDLGQAPDQDFTVVAIPDSQFYAQSFPEIFLAQTQYIVDNRKALNVKFVTHEGDIVHLASIPTEWDVADAAMSLIEDPAATELPEGIPYGLSVGNHDQSPNNYAGYPADTDQTTQDFNAVFGVARFQNKSWYGGHQDDNNDNNFQLFEAAGMQFIVIHLEFDDSHFTMLPDQLQWLDDTLTQYPDRRAIITSHSLLCGNGNPVSCPATTWAEFSVQGQQIYDIAKNHANVFLMLCGHAAHWNMQPRRSDTFNGNTIHTVMANYHHAGQWCANQFCGRGWQRIMKFQPASDTIDVETYSPWLDEYLTGPCLDGTECHQFVLPYGMESGVQPAVVGSAIGAASGTTVCVDWSGRQSGANYEWHVALDNGTEVTTGPRWTFQSDGTCGGDADCDDLDPCTQDSCSGSVCQILPIAGCCVADADCDDDNYCTDDSCVLGSCSWTDATRGCNDGNSCTDNDTCSSGLCSGAPLDCDDGNACTLDGCLGGGCTNDPAWAPGCCVADLDCDDGNRCTDDSCDVSGSCVNTLRANCCVDVAECDDANSCTVDSCPPINMGAIVLDGVDDHVTVGRTGDNPFGMNADANLTTFTLELWFQWDGSGETASTYGFQGQPTLDIGGIDAIPLITKGRGGGRAGRDDDERQGVNYFLGIRPADAVIPVPVLAADFEEHLSGSANWGVNHPVYGSSIVTPGVWHHAALTYDGACWQLYLDGLPETAGTNCPAEPPAYENLNHLAFGAAQDMSGGAVGRFGGMIDEVRIWNRALSLAEIQLHRFEQIGFDPDLVGRWSLDGLEPGSNFITADHAGDNVGIVVRGSFTSTGLVDLGGGSCNLIVVLPAPVAGVTVANGSPTGLAWVDQGAAITYDIAGGSLNSLRTVGDFSAATCLASGISGPTYDDPSPDPKSGDGAYYLIRSIDACGAGSYGSPSTSGERDLSSACP